MRYAIRSLRLRPAFTAAAVLTIALALGANTALFGVIYAVLIQPLPFRDPNQLVQIWETHPALSQLQVTVPDFVEFERRTKSFEQIAAHTLSAMNTATLLGQGEPDIVHAAMASSNLFPTMGIQPLLGRSFTGDEEREKRRVAVLSEGLWRRKFGADPSIAGKQIQIGNDSFTVVGVTPQRQAFPEWADLWIPLSLIEGELANRRKYHPLEVIARLKPGVTAEQAQVEIQAIAQQLAQAYPDTNKTVGAYVIPLARQMTREMRPPLLLAWGAVGLVLLIACANLAHLFLARMLEKRRELHIREALGAKARHLMGQVMWESLLVALMGGIIGVAMGGWAIQFAQRLAPGQIQRIEFTALEGPVLLFASTISVICGILFGLPACWQVMRSRAKLSGGGRAVVRGRSRLSSALMAAEVAMALLVLTGAALLTRTFAALLTEDPGFRAERVLTISNLPLRSDWDKSGEFLKTQLMPALRKVRGVEDVAAVNSAPMSLGATEHSRFATRFGVEGRTFDAGSYPVAQNRWITPGYFSVLGIPLKSGRLLTEADSGTSRIVINEALARRFFPGQDATGKRLVLGVMDPKPDLIEIVGVVGNVRDLGLDQEPEPTLYGVSTGPSMTLVVKTAAANPDQFAAEIRYAIHGVDPAIPVLKLQPLEQSVADSLERRRFALTLVGIFGGIAAFLTAAGIFGLLSYSVNARLREFGVRAAVGASAGELVRMILREAAALTLPGFAIGLLFVAGLFKVMESFVYGLSPADPVSIGCAVVFLVVLTLIAAWMPARRAARVDPSAALRAE
jgi:predicted permease